MYKGIEVTELLFNDEVPYELVEYINVETPFNHPALDKSMIVTLPETNMDTWRVHLCNLNIMERVFLFDLLDHALNGDTYADMEEELYLLRERCKLLEKELKEALEALCLYETGRWQ